MLAELLLVLGGHPSSLFGPGVSPSLAEHLHPGEVAALETLVAIATDYRTVRTWAEGTQAAARAAVLRGARKGKAPARGHDHGRAGVNGADAGHGQVKENELGSAEGPGQYLAVLAGAVRAVLADYDELVVRTEAAVLSLDPGVVQDAEEGEGEGYVPLSLLIATFDAWQAPLAALVALVARLSPSSSSLSSPTPILSPGALMTHLDAASSTGHPILRLVFTRLCDALWSLFLQHLTIFLLDGVALDAALSTPQSPALGLDAGADPPHRIYKLNNALLPASVGPPTRECVLYVGRVAATLKREGRALPRSLLDRVRADVLAAPYDGLDGAVQRARREVGEWLWTHILTGPQVADAIETFANYFLTRDADFTLNAIREIARLRRDRLLLANPQSSSSVIRAHDLDLALLRASVGTSAESDRALETLSWTMPLGPLRATPLPPAVPDDGSVRALFTPALLGTPISLTAAVSWPLDLFMTPPAVAAYGDIQAYLYAIRDAHTHVLQAWSALSGAQRRRRQYTGVDEGGAGAEKDRRTALARTAWGTTRAMLFFLDQLLSHFMTDIIGVQHRRLLEQLAGAAPTSQPTSAISSASSPAKGAGYLDFLTLRQMHARHLAFLREGLLIAERESAVLVRDILDVCKRFAGLVERWGGDVLPELLDDGEEGAMVTERARAVDEICGTLHDLICDFFRMLLDAHAPPAPAGDVSTTSASASASASASGVGSRGSRSVSMSRARVTQIMSRSRLAAGGAAGQGGTSTLGVSVFGDDSLMARHVEQLLLRLDFNGVLSRWLEGRTMRNFLPPGFGDARE